MVYNLYLCVLCCAAGHAMSQAVGHQPFIADAHVWFQANQCGICSGQSSTETGFSSMSVFLCQYHFTNAFTFIVIIYHRCCVIIETDSIIKEGFSLSLALFSCVLHCYGLYIYIYIKMCRSQCLVLSGVTVA